MTATSVQRLLQGTSVADFTDQPVTIKKYANRRLYNTATSSYVTLDDLAQMVKDNIKFNVYDARTSDDLTRSVLAQIIFEEESKTGQNLLPIGFLRQLISFYGDSLQWLVPRYLEHTMEALASNQERIRACFDTAFGGMFPFGNTLEEVGKQNIAMFDRAMRMFMPFGTQEGVMPGMPFAFAPLTEAAVSRKEEAQDSRSKAKEDTVRQSRAASATAQAPAAASTGTESAKPVRMATVSSLVTHLAGQQAQTITQPRNSSPVSSGAMSSRPVSHATMASGMNIPTPAVAQAAAAQEAALATGKEVQNKIAALQKQLAELKKKGKA